MGLAAPPMVASVSTRLEWGWCRNARRDGSRTVMQSPDPDAGPDGVEGGKRTGSAEQHLPVILSNAYERYGAYSVQMSAVVRSLAITGVAVAWLLAGGLTSDTTAAAVLANIRCSPSLLWGMALTLCALLFDSLHYAWASAAWGVYGWVLNELWASRRVPHENRGAGSRFAWLIAPLFRLDQYVNFHGQAAERGFTRGDSSRSVADQILSSAESSVGLTKALDQPWSPKFINRGSLAFFWLKIVCVTLAYGCLLVAVLNM